jgi:hypothetical protein
MQFDDASGEVKDRILQGQRPQGKLPAGADYVPRFHFWTEGGSEQARPDIYQFSAGGEQRGHEADAANCA